MAMGLRNRIFSYNNRLFLIVLLFIWGIISSILVFQYFREKQYKSEYLNAQLQLHNRYLIHAIEDGLDYEKIINENPAPFDSLRITIISLNGTVIYDSKLNINSLDNHLHRPEIINTANNGEGFHIGRQSDSDGRKYFYSATKGNRVIVRSAIPYSDSLHELLKADLPYLWGIIIISIIFSVVAFFTSRRLGKTIIRLNKFAQTAENGGSITETEEFPNDELGKISQSIIKLYSDLQNTIAERDKEHKEKLHEEQEKIRIKRQLSNNITHELKTPVASIQVCLETILSSGIQLNDEKRRELLDRCYSNCSRLRHLLNDVSLITRMEEGSLLIAKEEIDTTQIINEVIDDANTNNENFIIHNRLSTPIKMRGNRALIASIFSNLISNAIAYSGGGNIYISLITNNNSTCAFSVEDDGCGIDDIHLSRIFERFYRIDKGRSRKLGGTGLGLAIVKHAVAFHGGEITATNRNEGGLKFTFSLQKQ